MPNLETSVDQFRNGLTSHRKASFIENLSPNTQQSQSRKNSHTSAPTPVKEEVLYKSQTLQLNSYTYSDTKGNQKSVEVIHKRYPTGDFTYENVDNPEGILSIAILKRHILCDCLILVKKYRPSLKSFVLEFPAKIVEHGPGSSPVDSDGNDSDHSSIGDAAVKNVEENTGYRSTQINWVSPETAVDPELSDNKLKLVSLIIDGDDPIKNNFFCDNVATSDFDDSHTCTADCMDDVEVIPVPVNGLLDRLNEYSRKQIMVDSRVYSFAIGLKKGEKLAQSVLKPENIEIAI